MTLARSYFFDYCLCLEVAVQSLLPHFTADSRVFKASERSIGSEYAVAVLEDSSSSESFCNVLCFLDVVGDYSCAEAIFIGVGPLDDLIDVIVFEDALNRPKNFLFSYRHIVFHIGEDSWLDEITEIPVSLSSSYQSCPFSNPSFYV